VKRIYENDNFLSFPDANPVGEGHSLIISKKHFDMLLDLPNTLGSELLDCIKGTALRLINECKAEGFNIMLNNGEVAGQIIKHVHFHILPRKKGDKKRGIFIG
jgi:histidine triad (HIT) family protein